MRILLVEDNPADADLLTDVLKESAEAKIDLTRAQTLGEALRAVTSGPLDLVLLDLSLPDAQELQGLSTLRGAVPHIPIIVFTGRDDQHVAVQAVQEGAQDYLIKGQLDAHLLIRAFRYAIERARTEEMARKLAAAQASREEAERQIERYRRELVTLRGAVDQRPPDRVATLAQTGSAGDNADLRAAYGQLLDRAFEQQSYKVEYDLYGGVQRLARALFEREARPLDVVEVHGHELDSRTKHDNWVRSRAYVEVGRLVLIRVLGQLLELYRDAFLKSREGRPST